MLNSDYAVDCQECKVQPTIEYKPGCYEPYFICPVCGCSVNPQSTVSKAILAWNSKQQYLAQAV